jgi:hypothetical protein
VPEVKDSALNVARKQPVDWSRATCIVSSTSASGNYAAHDDKRAAVEVLRSLDDPGNPYDPCESVDRGDLHLAANHTHTCGTGEERTFVGRGFRDKVDLEAPVSEQLQTHIADARNYLLQLRQKGVGWGYRSDGPPYTEPTAVGCLALLATNDQLPLDEVDELVVCSAEWMQELQQPDGGVGIASDLPVPKWPTAFAALLWSQLPQFQRCLASSLRWLQQREGHTFVKTKECVLGHDTSIPGWPWVAGTHPWLEPTAMAVMALCRNQLAGHQRIRDGVRMILDRAIASGGWNVGNSSAFGKQLRPQAGSTGLALLALKAARQEETPTITRGCRYLAEALPTTRSPETLAWGLLGLLAWRPQPDEAMTWLLESFSNQAALKNSPMRLSMLLLAAASADTLPRLGVPLAESAPVLLEGPLS